MLYALSDLSSISSDVYAKMWWPLRNFTSKPDISSDRWKTMAFKLNVDSLCVGQMSGFSQFIPNMSNYTDQLEQLYAIKSDVHQFASINHIYIMSLDLTKAHIECIKEILARVEVVQVRDCRFEGDFYNNFLQFCANMKCLYVQNIDLDRYEFEIKDSIHETSTIRNEWLTKEYPLLENFELTPQNGGKIDELKDFFVQNPNIHTFSTNSLCLYENWTSLIETSANLDYLIMDFNCWPRVYLDSMCDVLNFLHQRNFYQRLHLYLPHLGAIPTDDAISLTALDKLYVKKLYDVKSVFLFKQLKELDVFEVAKGTDLQAIAKGLTNLERVYFKTASSNVILAFIRHSPKLRLIKVQNLEPGTHLYGRIIDLGAFNKERLKLNGARKVKIFVNKIVFAMSKFRVEKSKFKCVKLNKIDLNEMNEKFGLLTRSDDFICLEHFAIESSHGADYDAFGIDYGDSF